MRTDGNGRALMEPNPDNKIVQYPRRLDLGAMGEDRAALGWIATSANIWEMKVLEVADEHVSVTARFGFMDENGGSSSEMFKAIANILDLCYGVRIRDWDAVEARRSGLELEVSVNSLEIDGGEGAKEDDTGENSRQKTRADAEAAPAAKRVRDVVTDNDSSHAEEEEAPEAGRLGDGDSEDDNSVSSGWGRPHARFGVEPVLWADERMWSRREASVSDFRMDILQLWEGVGVQSRWDCQG